MKKYVVGDIHGCYKALVQCLERSKFDYATDKLICLGDVCDGFPFVKECFDELLKINNLVYILGNHDDWALEWYDRDDIHRYEDEEPEPLWTQQGGQATIDSYEGKNMPKKHLDILKKAKLYHIEDNKLFTHGGIKETESIEETDRNVFLWDRDMLRRVAMVHPVNPDFKIQKWDNIFIGHTTTQSYDTTLPLRLCNVTNIDTGAGWSGKLTIMDIDSGEFWQSDMVKDLYEGVQGRG